MTTEKKCIKKVMIVLLTALLIAVFSAGCAFFGIRETGLKQLSEITEESIVLVSMDHGPHSFALPKEEYGKLVGLFRKIAETKVLKEELGYPNPDDVEYAMVVLIGDNTWIIGCVKNGPSGANVFLVASNMTTAAGETHLYWVHSNEMYRFISATMDAYVEERIPSSTPAAVMKHVESILDDHLTDFIQEEGTDAVLGYQTELRGLTLHDTGTAGLNEAVFLYCVEYNIVAEMDTYSVGKSYTRYLALGFDYLAEEYTLLDVLTEEEIEKRYGTSEMLAEYGDMYVAAAMELYGSYLEMLSAKNAMEENLVYHVPQAIVDYAYKVGFADISFLKYESETTETELTAIQNMNSGVAGDDFAVDVYYIEFLTTNISSPSAFSSMGFSYCLVVLWQDVLEGETATFVPLGYLKGKESTYFESEEMLNKYGSFYTAVAESFYAAYLADQEKMGEYPATPGQALENLCSRSDTLSVGHYWRFFGDAEWTKADSTETLDYWHPYLDELFWVEVEYVPDEQAGCTFTLVSEDGTETISAILDWNLIGYTFEGETTYWIAADNRYHEAADLARNIYFKNLYAAEVARTTDAVNYGFYEFNFNGRESQLIIETGQTEKDRVYHFYGLVNGKLLEIATVNGAYSYLANGVHEYGEQDLVLAGAHEGEEWAYRLKWEGFRAAKAEVIRLYRRDVNGNSYTEWPDRVEMYDVSVLKNGVYN